MHCNEELKALFVLACHVESKFSMEGDRQTVGLIDVASEPVNPAIVRKNRDLSE